MTLIETVLLFGISGISSILYLLYRMNKIITLTHHVIHAYDDNTISEGEFKIIMDDLRKVVYKK